MPTVKVHQELSTSSSFMTRSWKRLMGSRAMLRPNQKTSLSSLTWKYFSKLLRYARRERNVKVWRNQITKSLIKRLLKTWKEAAAHQISQHTHLQEIARLFFIKLLRYSRRQHKIKMYRRMAERRLAQLTVKRWREIAVAQSMDRLAFQECARKSLIKLQEHAKLARKVKAVKTMVCRRVAREVLNSWKDVNVSQGSENSEALRIKCGLYELSNRWIITTALLACWTSNSVFAVFEIWKHWYRTRVLRKERKLAALNQLSKVLLQKGLKSLQMIAGLGKRLRCIKSNIKTRIQVRTLRCLSHLAQVQQQAKQMDRVAMLHYQRKVYAFVWISWLKHITESQSISLANEKAHTFNRLTNFRKALRGWFSVVKEDTNKIESLTALRIRMDYSCLRDSLDAWHYETLDRKNKARNLAYMVNRRHKLVKFKLFHLWKCFCHREKCLRAAAEIHRRYLQNLYFKAWLSFAAIFSTKRKAYEMVTSRLRKLRMTAFLGWKDVANMVISFFLTFKTLSGTKPLGIDGFTDHIAQAKHFRLKRYLAACKLRHLQLSRSFHKWRHLISSAAILRQFVNGFVQERRRKLFWSWLAAAQEQTKLHVAFSATARIHRVNAARRILRSWKDRITDVLWTKEQRLKACRFRKRHVLKAFFKKLIDWKAHRQRRRIQFITARNAMYALRKRLFLNVWAMQAYIGAEERIAVAQFRDMQQKRLKLRTLLSLRYLTEENWHMKKQVLRAFQEFVEGNKLLKAAAWRNKFLLLFTIQKWRAEVMRRRAASRFLWNLNMKTLRLVFKQWRLEAQHRRHLQSIFIRVSYCHRTLVLKTFWPYWRSHAHASRIQAQCLVYRCLKKWVDHFEEAAYWRCKQKQVTYLLLQSLEKRIIWAWHSLVREISVRRVEHQQQRLSQREALGIATRRERRQKTELLQSVLASWKTLSQRTISILAFGKKLKLRLKRQVWREWLVLVGQSHSFKKLKWKWMMQLKRKSLERWRNSTVLRIRESQEYEQEASRIGKERCMKKAWTQWQIHLRQIRGRAKVLQNCVSLIEAGQFRDTLRDIMEAWEGYRLHKNKRREQRSAADAAYRRHKLTDYLSAWRHYSAASIDSAAKLRGSIQLYQHRKRDVMDSANDGSFAFPPSVRHYRQSIQAFQRQQQQQQQHQELIIQELRNSSPREDETSVEQSQDHRQQQPQQQQQQQQEKVSARRELTRFCNGDGNSVTAARHMYDSYKFEAQDISWFRCMVQQVQQMN